MDESGADGACRGAGRLARSPPGSGVKMKSMRPRVWNMVAPWPVRQSDTRDRPGARRYRRKAHEKTAAPVRGRAVSGSWYHPNSRPHR